MELYGRRAWPPPAGDEQDFPRPIDLCPSNGEARVNPNYGGYALSNHAVVYGAAPFVDDERPGSGVFAAGRGVRLEDITDGAAQTFALGERAMTSDGRGAAIWMRSVNALGNGPDGTAVAGVCHRTARLNNQTNPEAFSSSHAGGAHFLLADGQVRFIDETIDVAIYESLASRGDGRQLPGFVPSIKD